MYSVTVGVLAYNEAEMLPIVWPTIYSQTTPPECQIIEYICISDASTDGTDSYLGSIAKTDARIRIYRNSTRQGKSAGINQLVKRMKGDILIVANADCVLHPHNFTALVAAVLPVYIGLSGSHVLVTKQQDTYITAINRMIWDLHHDIALHTPKISTAFAVKRSIMKDPIPSDCPVDEAYLEAYITKQGLKPAYADNAREELSVPWTLRDHVIQRRRYHHGYYWLKNHFPWYRPATLNFKLLLPLLIKQCERTTIDIVFSGIVIECYAMLLGWKDFYIERRNNGIWQTIHKSTN